MIARMRSMRSEGSGPCWAAPTFSSTWATVRNPGCVPHRGGSFTTVTKNSSIWRTTSMKRSKSTGFAT